MGKIILFPPPSRENAAELEKENDEPGSDSNPYPQAGPASADEQNHDSLSNMLEEVRAAAEADSGSVFDLIASMPNCISRKITLQVLAAIGFLLAGFAVLILLKSLQSILFFMVAGWIVWNAVLSIDDFKAGRIIEQAVVCVSVKVGRAGNTTRIVMRTANEEEPSYYEFNLAGRQTKEFTPNKVYIIYTKDHMPQSLFAYQEL